MCLLFKFPRKTTSSHKLFVWAGNPAGENPVCPQQFSEPVECHLVLLSWWYCHPYVLKGDKGQTQGMFCVIVVGRQVTVEAKKKKPQVMCFFWGGAAMCVFMDLNEKQRISQGEQKYCYPPQESQWMQEEWKEMDRRATYLLVKMCLYFCGESRGIEQKDGKKMDVCIANFLKDI